MSQFVLLPPLPTGLLLPPPTRRGRVLLATPSPSWPPPHLLRTSSYTPPPISLVWMYWTHVGLEDQFKTVYYGACRAGVGTGGDWRGLDAATVTTQCSWWPDRSKDRSWGNGGLEDWGAGGLGDWRTGGLEDWRTYMAHGDKHL